MGLSFGAAKLWRDNERVGHGGNLTEFKLERKDNAQKLRRAVFEPDFEKVFQTFGLFLHGVKDWE